MPWRVMSKENEIYKFVSEILDTKRKTSVKEICLNYAISTKTGYKWLHRYEEDGKEGLKDRPHTPKTNPNKISLEVEKAVIFLKKNYMTWGPKKIMVEFKAEFSHLQPPSVSSIGNILKKNNLTNSRVYRRHVALTAPLEDCSAPNHTWMYDFKGWFLVQDGSKCEPLTITDGFSRFLINCQHMNRKRGIDVWSVLERCFLEYGLPTRIRSDNGPPFASLSVGRLSWLSIRLIKVGIIPEWIEPGCPQQNGRHERFHLTLKQETATPPALTIRLQQEKFNQFQQYYNFKRPHEALTQKTPGSIYVPSKRVWDGKFKTPKYPKEYLVRKVGTSGNISWINHAFFISQMLKGEDVGLIEIKVGIMAVYFGPILLGEIDMNKGFKKK